LPSLTDSLKRTIEQVAATWPRTGRGRAGAWECSNSGCQRPGMSLGSGSSRRDQVPGTVRAGSENPNCPPDYHTLDRVSMFVRTGDCPQLRRPWAVTLVPWQLRLKSRAGRQRAVLCEQVAAGKIQVGNRGANRGRDVFTRGRVALAGGDAEDPSDSESSLLVSFTRDGWRFWFCSSCLPLKRQRAARRRRS
jgi:hypothetical protein